MTDVELVQATLQHANAYSGIVEKYEEKITRYVQRFLYLSKEDTEDIVQYTFINAYRYLHSYKQNLSFSSWIYRIAHNQCVDYLRKHHNRLSVEQSIIDHDDDDSQQKELFISDEDVELNVINILHQEQVISELAHLDTTSREILVLRYLEEKEYNEIADILKMSEGTVASLIHRAKSKLKRLITNEQVK